MGKRRSNSATVKDLLKALEGVDPETPILVRWSPGSDTYSQVDEMHINTYDMDGKELYVEGPDEPTPPTGNRTVEVFVIGPGYGGRPGEE